MTDKPEDPRKKVVVRKRNKYYQGKFKPINWKKYKGNPTAIYYRSGWELKYFSRLDLDPNVLEWSSEEIIVPYLSPKDGKVHRYFPDCYVKMKVKGVVESWIVEIKPKGQTCRPVRKPKQRVQTYLTEMLTWSINQAKWEAADAWAKKRGMKFVVLSEKHLGIK